MRVLAEDNGYSKFTFSTEIVSMKALKRIVVVALVIGFVISATGCCLFGSCPEGEGHRGGPRDGSGKGRGSCPDEAEEGEEGGACGSDTGCP